MKRSKLKLDFISITFPIKGEFKRSSIKYNINNIVPKSLGVISVKNISKSLLKTKDNYVGNNDNNELAKIRKKGIRYKYTYLLTVQRNKNNRSETYKVWISIYPIDKGNNFFRLQFNPNKAKQNGVKTLRWILADIIGKSNAKQLFYYAPVTRIDLALDIYNLKNEYFIHADYMRDSAIRSAINGGNPSQILGKGRTRVSYYDKEHEQGIVLDFDKTGKSNWMRLEVQLKNQTFENKRYTMSDLLQKLENPFTIISFYTGSFIQDENFNEDFRYSVLTNGISSALHGLDTKLRRQYKAKLDLYKRNLINFDKLWKSFPSSLDCIELLKPAVKPNKAVVN